MHTQDSILHGLKFIGTLGPVEKKLDDICEIEKTTEIAVTQAEIEKAGNPWRDQFGKFTDESNAVFNTNAALATPELEARAKEYEKASPNKDGFLHYTPKSKFSGNESKKWRTLNSAIGQAEGVAKAYMSRYRTMGEARTPEGEKQKRFWLANAGALRDMARILSDKRGGLKVKKSQPPAFLVYKEAGFPDFISDAFSALEETVSMDDDAGEFDEEQLKRIKAYIVNNAVAVELLSREEGDAILAQIK
jgi:hypothetical protein